MEEVRSSILLSSTSVGPPEAGLVASGPVLASGDGAAPPVDDLVLLAAAVVVVGVLTAAWPGGCRCRACSCSSCVGMVVADDGLGVVHFDDAELAQSVVGRSPSC